MRTEEVKAIIDRELERRQVPRTVLARALGVETQTLNSALSKKRANFPKLLLLKAAHIFPELRQPAQQVMTRQFETEVRGYIQSRISSREAKRKKAREEMIARVKADKPVYASGW